MLNKITLQGRFVETPEEKVTPLGVTVTSFRFAWSEPTVDDSKNVIFITCTAWRSLAEHICKYFKKGKEAIISGKLTQRKWTDKEQKTHTENEIKVEEIHFCGAKEYVQVNTQFGFPLPPANMNESPSFEDISGDDDLPF